MKWFACLSAGIVLLTGAKSVAANEHTELEKCAQIADNPARLDCFDAYASDILQSKVAEKTVRQQSGASEVKPAERSAGRKADTTPTAPQPEQTARKSETAVKEFGLENRQKPDKEEVEEVTSAVIGLEKSPRGKLILKLENGMIWQQKNDDYFKAEINDKATVSRGFFGVFYLGVEGTNRRIKVERID